MSVVLDIQHLSVAYNRKGLALEDVSLQVPQGGIVALLGANGAGKSTLIRAVTGLLDLHHGQITGGQVRMLGQLVSGMPAHRLVRMGMGQVPEGRLVFKHLSVEDNLLVGAAVLPRAQVKDGLDAVYQLFPRLLERRNQAAGWMSGGEQQMLALGRAMIAKPKLLLVDEQTTARDWRNDGNRDVDRRAKRPFGFVICTIGLFASTRSGRFIWHCARDVGQSRNESFLFG